jgi:hypothetical protein
MTAPQMLPAGASPRLGLSLTQRPRPSGSIRAFPVTAAGPPLDGPIPAPRLAAAASFKSAALCDSCAPCNHTHRGEAPQVRAIVALPASGQRWGQTPTDRLLTATRRPPECHLNGGYFHRRSLRLLCDVRSLRATFVTEVSGIFLRPEKAGERGAGDAGDICHRGFGDFF